MASPQILLHASSPLDRLAGNYVELDDLKEERSSTWSAKGDGPKAMSKEEIAIKRLSRLEIQDEGSRNWWIIESIAWLVSAIAVAVIVLTVAMTDGKPLPTWPMNVTLNSFISFMTTLMKAAAVVPVAECISQLKWLWLREAVAVRDIQTFDEASRGTWGSVKLLVDTRGIHLAKLGALITIILLAVEPCVQQVITYQTEPIVLTGYNSSAPVASMYNDYSYGSIMAIREPTMAMKAAINNGMFDTADEPQADFSTSASCATGNCSWPFTYHSLAVCSKCANTTALITSNCGEQFGTLPATCNYSLPNGMSFDGRTRGNMYMNASGSYDSLAYNNTQSTFATLSSIRGLHDLSSTNLLGVVSNECVLYFCVNEYQGNVTNGIFTETIVSSYTGDETPGVDQNITITVSGTETQFWVGFHAWTFGRGVALYTFGEDGSGSGTQKVGGENNTVAAVAAAMTKALRTNGIPASISEWTGNITDTTSDRFALGTAWTGDTFVHVRWLWLILPMALEVLTLMFLVGTIIQSNHSGLPGWKSSTLPLIQGKVSELQQAVAAKRHQKGVDDAISERDS
ncbi:hypothetical protein TruAng_003843 [Truncatella angustata]|nr:hypothetical protein TruAng_003843 [Truncatella angustata]